MVINETKWCAFTNSIYALTLFAFVSSLLLLLLIKPDIYFLKEKYRNNKINPTDKLTFKQVLEKYMKESRPYTNPEIRLETISNSTNINCRVLSQIINETYQCTFKSYINSYRINECIRELSDPYQSDKTVKEIMYETGFNSKSAFNTAFKRSTGLSPVEFRKNILEAMQK
jgi:AraC-like DNA-binding protein